jgi:hypothetical protein
MRVALLFRGRLDFFKEQYTKIFDVIGREHIVDIFYSSDYEPPEKISEFKELFKPVKMVNERIIYDNYISKYSSDHTITLKSSEYTEKNNFSINYTNECQYINLMRVFMLLEEHIKETNIRYDLVICTRIDLNCFSRIPIFIPEKNTIYIPFHSDYGNGINDHFAMGPIEAMKKYCNLYKNLLYLLENKRTLFHSENITKANLIYNNIYVRRFSLIYRIALRTHDDSWAGGLH